MRIPLDDRQRGFAALGLALLACAFYGAALFVPMWGWYLTAPQYPDGLVMAVYMNKITGDITEIDILNHYIGMGKLEEAAQLERSLAIYGVIGIALVTLIGVCLPGRRFSKLLALPALGFPIVFLGFVYYWMYTFGHNLNPDAPVSVAPFTPTLLGPGDVGNFHTEGLPGAGFYLILGAAVAAGCAYLLRGRQAAPG